MRKLPFTALALAAAVAAPGASLAQYAAPAGSPLSSIFSCQAAGNRQSTGAVLGALLGGVVGNKVADNERGLGTVLGAAVGAAAGSYIGCRMQTSDQQRAQQATQQALERGQSQSWDNPQTGARGGVTLVSTQPYGQPAYQPPVSLAGLRFAAGVEPQRAYANDGGRYAAPGTVNLRAGPSTSAVVIGSLRRGDEIDGLARVQGSSWLLAGRNGTAIGYVAEQAVRSLEVAGPSSPVCRTFDQTYAARDGQPETQRYTACQTANGEWVVQG